MSVAASSDPVRRMDALDMLLGLTGVKVGGGGAEEGGGRGGTNERVASMASEALSDLFAHSLMPPDRRLFNLDRRPLGRYDRSSSSATVGGEGEGGAGGGRIRRAGVRRREGDRNLYLPVPSSFGGTRRPSRDDTLSTSIDTYAVSSAAAAAAEGEAPVPIRA